MELERGNLVSPTREVPVVEGEIVTAIRELAGRGWGSKAIAREPGIARNTARRYRRHPIVAGQQTRPPRRLTDDVVHKAQTLYTGVAEHDAVVVQRAVSAPARSRRRGDRRAHRPHLSRHRSGRDAPAQPPAVCAGR